VSNLSGGLYLLTVTDSRGCDVVESVYVAEPQPMQVAISANNISCCNNPSLGSAISVASGGSGNYTYDWGENGQGQQISNLTQGEYCVVVSDDNNCNISACTNINYIDNLNGYCK